MADRKESLFTTDSSCNTSDNYAIEQLYSANIKDSELNEVADKVMPLEEERVLEHDAVLAQQGSENKNNSPGLDEKLISTSSCKGKGDNSKRFVAKVGPVLFSRRDRVKASLRVLIRQRKGSCLIKITGKCVKIFHLFTK
ncbi:uncharacterized protein LOC142348244 isoform X2 [Convolutriloba macropyga]|uniref:uncharacterized protein LOC142348244 isoform X2 n=1 Tax=Convolutriloba macropyga TaxID=536237 RepID=UPI003F52098D